MSEIWDMPEGMRGAAPKLEPAGERIARLERLLRETRSATLVDMTADRDSWMQQTDMAREDALRVLGELRAVTQAAEKLAEALRRNASHDPHCDTVMGADCTCEYEMARAALSLWDAMKADASR